MSIHLVGGGWSDDYDGEVYAEFIAEAAARASNAGRAVPVIGVLLVRDEAPQQFAAAAVAQYQRAGSCEPRVTVIAEGDLFTREVLDGIDGLLVGGGLTPAYLDAVMPIVDELRLLVADGLPYLGFSAGAAIASDTALVGGWLIEGIPVCAEECGEDLDDVTITAGLGLVDLAIDVHAAQWGTLARLIAATEAGLVDGGVAIDEFTALIVSDDYFRVVGRGSVWQVTSSETGVLVNTLGA